MQKIILIFFLALYQINFTYAQVLGHPAQDKRSTAMKELNWGYQALPNMTNKDTGWTDVEISFEDQNKVIYIKSVNLSNLVIKKGNKTLPKYLSQYKDGYKIIHVPLEGDYIIQYNQIIIESYYKKLYINKKEVKKVALIDGKKIGFGQALTYWEGKIH